jgi:hypothetical protein
MMILKSSNRSKTPNSGFQSVAAKKHGKLSNHLRSRNAIRISFEIVVVLNFWLLYGIEQILWVEPILHT